MLILRTWIFACFFFIVTPAHAFLIVPDAAYEAELRATRNFGKVLPDFFSAHTELFRLKLKNGKHYEIWVMQPEHLANVYFQISALCGQDHKKRADACDLLQKDPKPLQSMLHLNRLFAYSQLSDAYHFLLQEWKDAGLFVEGYGEGRTRELNTIRDGLWPTMIVRELPGDGPIDPSQSYPIVWVVSYAIDYGEGLPWEWRLYHPDFPVKGISKVHSPPPVPLRHVFPATPYLDFSVDPFLSALMSERSYMSGGRVEIKNYLKAQDYDEDLAAVVHKLMTRFQFHRWGASLVFPTPKFRSTLRKEKAEFLAKHQEEIASIFVNDDGVFVPDEANLIIDTAFGDYAFPFSHISEVFVEANSYASLSQGSKNGRSILFNRRYAIKEKVLSVEGDPDFGGRTDILRTTPSQFEVETAAALMKSPGSALVDGAHLTRVGMMLTGAGLPICPQMITWGNIPERLLSIGPEGLLMANPWQQWIYSQDY